MAKQSDHLPAFQSGDIMDDPWNKWNSSAWSQLVKQASIFNSPCTFITQNKINHVRLVNFLARSVDDLTLASELPNFLWIQSY